MDNIAFSTLFFSWDYPDGIITNGVLVVMFISYSLPYDFIILLTLETELCPKASTVSHVVLLRIKVCSWY